MNTLLLYLAAAVAEIAGCFSVWAWLRDGRSAWWLLPGAAALAAFAFLLSGSQAAFAGRAYAAYGGVYVATALLWLWVIEGVVPDRWDILGAVLVLAGALCILNGRFLARP